MTHDVFISYSTQDQQIAEDVVNYLEKNDVECWIAPRDINSGKSYSAEIIDGLKSAKLVILIYSHNSQDSSYVNNEIEVAFSENKPIIAFKIEESMPKDKLEFFLKNSQWLEATPQPEEHYPELLNDVKIIIEEQNKHDVYICYENEDKQTADAICHALEENNIRCWIKPRDLSVKHETEETMEAIKESKLVVLVYSNYSKNSNYVNNEIDLAFSYNLPIFTFNIDNSKLEGGLEFFLKGQHWLDAYPNPSKEFKQLIIDASSILGKPVHNELKENNNNEINSLEYDNKNNDKKENSQGIIKNKKIILIGAGLFLLILVGILLFSSFTSNPSLYVTDVSFNNQSSYYTVWGKVNDLPFNNGYTIKTEFFDSSGKLVDEYNQDVASLGNEINGEYILAITKDGITDVTKIKLTLYDSHNQKVSELEKIVDDISYR